MNPKIVVSQVSPGPDNRLRSSNPETSPDDLSSVSKKSLSMMRSSYNARKSIVQNQNQKLLSNKSVRQAIASKSTPNSVGPRAILVDFNPKKYVTRNLSEKDIIQLKEVFDYYDSDDTGLLAPLDLKWLLQSNGYNSTKETLYGIHYVSLKKQEIFADLDEEELGGITFEYFLKALDPEKVKKEKNFTIRRVFKKYDKKNKGYINFDDLKNIVFREFQEEVDLDILKEIFDRTDSNKDGKITFEDFYNVMTKKVYY